MCSPPFRVLCVCVLLPHFWWIGLHMLLSPTVTQEEGRHCPLSTIYLFSISAFQLRSFPRISSWNIM